MEIKQKWILENWVYYPIPGNTTLHVTPGTGVFQIFQEKSMGGSRLGLVNIADAFQFNFKIYNLGIDDIMDKVEKTWNSDVFVNGQKNLGVIFNGLKGTGKTIAAKILSNRMGMPVVIVDAAYRVCGFFRLVTPYVRNKVVPLPYGTDQATTRHSSGCAYRQLRCCKF